MDGKLIKRWLVNGIRIMEIKIRMLRLALKIIQVKKDILNN